MLSSTDTTDVLAVSAFPFALSIAYIVLAFEAGRKKRGVMAIPLPVLPIPFVVILAIHPGSHLWYRFCLVIVTLCLAIPQILAIYVLATRCQYWFATAAGLLELVWIVAGPLFLQTQLPMVPLIFGHSLFGYVVAEHYVKTVRHSRDTTTFIHALNWISFWSSVGAAIFAFAMFVLACLNKAIDYPLTIIYVLTTLKLVPIMILDHIKDRTRESIPSQNSSSPQDQSHRSVNLPTISVEIDKDRVKDPIPESRKYAQNQDGPLISRFSDESLRPLSWQNRKDFLTPIYDRLRRLQQPLGHLLT